MPAVTNHYDLVVLGADLAGLVSAAIVARRGKRVLVMPGGPADGSYRVGAQTFALCAAPVDAMGSPAVEATFSELGLLQQVRREHGPVQERVHWIADDARLDLRAGAQGLGGQSEREWPGQDVAAAWTGRTQAAKGPDELIDELLAGPQSRSADALWSRKGLGKISGGASAAGPAADTPLPDEHPAQTLARLAEPWLCTLSPRRLGHAGSLRMFRRFMAGPGDVHGGQQRLRQILLQRIELHSGEVRPQLRLGELSLKRGRVSGLTLLGKNEFFGADTVVVAQDPRRMLDAGLPATSLHKQVVASLAAIATGALRFVMNVEVARTGLSPALDTMALIAPKGATARSFCHDHGVGSTYLRRRSGPNEEVDVLQITRIISPDQDVTSLRESIVAELDRRGVLPFIHRHIVAVHSPHDGRGVSDGEGNPIEMRQDHLPPALPMAEIVDIAGEAGAGVSLLPPHSGIKNLHLASALTLPGLGMEGQFVAGMVAANLVTPPTKTPFSRSPLLRRV